MALAKLRYGCASLRTLVINAYVNRYEMEARVAKKVGLRDLRVSLGEVIYKSGVDRARVVITARGHDLACIVPMSDLAVLEQAEGKQ